MLITGDTRTETIQTLRASGLFVLHKPGRAIPLRSLLIQLMQEAAAGSGHIPKRPLQARPCIASRAVQAAQIVSFPIRLRITQTVP